MSDLTLAALLFGASFAAGLLAAVTMPELLEAAWRDVRRQPLGFIWRVDE